MGMEESAGVVGTSGPGDGKSGAISGGSPCRLEDGGELVKNAGEAEMLEAFELKERRGEAMRAVMRAIFNQKEAISNDEGINSHKI